jgi:hypothetical protein
VKPAKAIPWVPWSITSRPPQPRPLSSQTHGHRSHCADSSCSAVGRIGSCGKGRDSPVRAGRLRVVARDSRGLRVCRRGSCEIPGRSRCVSLTMTIRLTDDAMSLGRRDGGYDIHFFVRPRRDPHKDSRILSLFANIGVQPIVDDVCDRGRTRVLEFPIPPKRDSIVELWKRVLTEVSRCVAATVSASSSSESLRFRRDVERA